MQSQGYNHGQFPLSHVCYDVVSILYEKSKALEAYDKFIKDAGDDQELSSLLTKIRQDDAGHVEQLKGCLARLLEKKAS